LIVHLKMMIQKRQGVNKARSASIVALGVLTLVALWTGQPCQAAGQGGQDGKSLFEKRCSGCHALDADHEGPRLRGVFGRPAAKVKTFKYSEALQKAKVTWDEVELDKWLTDTESIVPDNDMGFRVPKQEERAAIISYLKSLSTP
jgi:cytochrome c